MKGGTVQDVPPLPPTHMRLDEECLAVEGPVGWNIVFDLLTGLFEGIKQNSACFAKT
jgi:hypothetical protein